MLFVQSAYTEVLQILTCNGESRTQGWTAHINGAARLLELLDMETFRDKQVMFLFLVIWQQFVSNIFLQGHQRVR